MNDITYRPGTTEDSYAVFCIFEEALADLMQRMGHMQAEQWNEPEKLAQMWQWRRPLYEHLAQHACCFWVAEQDGQVIGFARAMVRGQVQQLTEFFIRPGVQSGGVGRELLARAFPDEGLPYRSIIATTDIRAQARYLKAGVYPQFPLYYFWRSPEPAAVETDLTIEPMAGPPETLATLDMTVLNFRRDEEHAWLREDRQGYVYRRDGRVVGYGYVGKASGPFALQNAADFPAVLAHAETALAAAGLDHFGMEVPLCNHTAVDYLLARGFQIDSFVALLMCNRPFGRLDQYIVTGPPFFL